LSCFINVDIEYCRPSVSYSTNMLQFCRQMSKNVSYIIQTIFIWYGIPLHVNVVPQCGTTLQYVVSYVKFLNDFVQAKYCSSNETRRWIVFTSSKTNRWKMAIKVSSHNFRRKRCYTMMTFCRILKVLTWLVGFPYQLSIISALIRK
jgi:hypothetical protein